MLVDVLIDPSLLWVLEQVAAAPLNFLAGFWLQLAFAALIFAIACFGPEALLAAGVAFGTWLWPGLFRAPPALAKESFLLMPADQVSGPSALLTMINDGPILVKLPG